MNVLALADKCSGRLASLVYLLVAACLVLGLPGLSWAKPPAGFSTVVLDPGHGGDDRGAVSAAGEKESEITLRLARQVAAILADKQRFRIGLTRKDDYRVSLDERAGYANHRQADVFVSLHVGSAFTAAPQGFRVYYWVPAGDESPLPEKGAAWDRLQSSCWQRSRRLAAEMERQLRASLTWPSGGAMGLDLYVLGRVTMPAVLVELGSLRNATEAGELQRRDFIALAAGAIAAAIEAYLNEGGDGQ